MRLALFAVLLAASLLSPGCAFHSEARQWNGRVDPDGHSLYFASTTKVGMKLFVIIPLLGDLGIDGMVDELTAYVADQGGDGMSIVQGGSENYWYGFPPLTWIFTPVVSTLAATYRPTPEQLAADLERWIAEQCANMCGDDCDTYCDSPCGTCTSARDARAAAQPQGVSDGEV
jgi:hypothetical protein